MGSRSVKDIIARRAAAYEKSGRCAVIEAQRIDANGNVMVNDAVGAMSKAENADTIIFTTFFSRDAASGKYPVYELGNGYMKVAAESKRKGLVSRIRQPNCHGKKLLKQGKRLVYVTERCVFELTGNGLSLTEVCPGMDIQKDILDQLAFTPTFSKNLGQMPAEVFEY